MPIYRENEYGEQIRVTSKKRYVRSFHMPTSEELEKKFGVEGLEKRVGSQAAVKRFHTVVGGDWWFASGLIMEGSLRGSYAFEGPYRTEQEALDALTDVKGLSDVKAESYPTRDKIKAKQMFRVRIKNTTRNIVSTFARRYTPDYLRRTQHGV